MSRVTELNRRGIALKREGKFEDAASCYEKAIRLQPDFAEAHFNLGLLWRDVGRVEQAVTCLERTAALCPEVAMVQFELGRLYLDQRRWSDAEFVFQRMADSDPTDLNVSISLAVAWQELGRLDDAAAVYRRILEQHPQHAIVLTNLGNILKSRGQLPEAIGCYENAIAASPELIEAHANLGNTWLECGQFESAYAEFSIAASLSPRDPRRYVDLGNALQRVDRHQEAADAYRQAIELDPNAMDAWLNTGHLLKEVGDFRQAGVVCHQLARRFPDEPVHTLRAAAVCPLVFGSREEMQQYRQELETIANSIRGVEWNLDFARWTNYAPECPYNLQFLDGDLRPLKEAFANLYARHFASQNEQSALRVNQRSRPRIGFVVTARHEAGFLKSLGGVVERLNGQRWELVVLCSQFGVRQIRSGLQRDDIEVVPFPERFDHIVATVRDADCDLLYYWEVGNDPTNYFLPFLRLSPVQVTSWGIQVTTGIPGVDAYMSSDLVESAGAESHYTEKLVRSSTLLTYQTRAAVPRPGSREQFGLADDQHVYGCVQNLGKFHPDFDDVLAEILRRDERGVVVVAKDRNGLAAEILRSRWQVAMPDVASRIRFVPPLAQHDYLSLLAKCDVLLDPIHFGGVNTTYDALAVNQPIVTLPTDFHRGRYTAACMQKIGVRDTVARDHDDYVNIAVQLGIDADRRNALCERLQAASHVAFEDQGAVREHERIFEVLLSGGR